MPLPEERGGDEPPALDPSVNFTPDGEFIYSQVYAQGDTAVSTGYTFFRADGFQRVTAIPKSGVRIIPAAIEWGDDKRAGRFVIAWRDASGGAYLWDLSEAKPKLIKELILPENWMDSSVFSINAEGTRLVYLSSVSGKAELWGINAGKKLNDLDIPGRFGAVRFTLTDNALRADVEGGTVSLFRASDGEKPTDEIRNIGGTNREIYFDEKCRRAHVWTDEGRVLRYTEGWYLFGRESWFWPAVKCDAR
jgi:hypothetical protein